MNRPINFIKGLWKATPGYTKGVARAVSGNIAHSVHTKAWSGRGALIGAGVGGAAGGAMSYDSYDGMSAGGVAGGAALGALMGAVMGRRGVGMARGGRKLLSAPGPVNTYYGTPRPVRLLGPGKNIAYHQARNAGVAAGQSASSAYGRLRSGVRAFGHDITTAMGGGRAGLV